MKQVKATIVAVSLMLSPLFAQSVDKAVGFPFNLLGKDPVSIPGMTFVKEDLGFLIHENRNDPKKLGGAKISLIQYAVYRENIVAMVITTKGKSDNRAMLDFLRSKCGKGEKRQAKHEEYLWRGNKIMIAYTERSITHDDGTKIIVAMTNLYHKELYTQFQEEDQKRRQSGDSQENADDTPTQ
jgi:hypothetical protein